jgi:uncharacterized iron-regulated membrane protein
LGLVKGPQDWKIGVDGGHAGHHGSMPMAMPSAPKATGLPLSAFVAKAEAEHMAFPVLVLPPGAPQRFGPPVGNEWMAKSEAQNRTLDRRVTYDPNTGVETGRSGFADQHIIDRVVNTGVAWHEGQLFGLANQLMGLATALLLIATSIFGVLMWLKRRPQRGLGAPGSSNDSLSPGLLTALIVLGLLLPLFGASVLIVLWLDRAIRARRGLSRLTGRARSET